jgi:hypothetical protein
MLSRIEGGDAEDVEKVVSIVESALYKGVDVPFEEVVGAQVVGAKHEFGRALVDKRVKGFEILSVTSLTNEDVHAAVYFFASLVSCFGFMVGSDTCLCIPSESVTGKQRSMSVDGISMLLCVAYLVKQAGITPQDGVNIHNFGKEMETRIGKKFADVLRRDRKRRIFKRGGGDTGRDADPEVKR